MLETAERFTSSIALAMADFSFFSLTFTPLTPGKACVVSLTERQALNAAICLVAANVACRLPLSVRVCLPTVCVSSLSIRVVCFENECLWWPLCLALKLRLFLQQQQKADDSRHVCL